VVLSVIGAIALLGGLGSLLIALFALARWAGGRRARAIAWQIDLTDAIHRALGPVAAPVVAKPALGPWTVTLAVPFGQPSLVAALTDLAYRVRGARAAGDAAVRIVLMPRAEPATAPGWLGPRRRG
jgi:hypothetical protein